MKFFLKSKGSVSIFLILILLPLAGCVFLAADTAGYSAAKAKVNGAVELAGNAALADYDRSLKELYGISAISREPEELTAELRSYYGEMIDTQGGRMRAFENLLRTQALKFYAGPTEGSALTEPEVFEKEIEAFMKYRAPLLLAGGVKQKLSAFRQLKETNEVMKAASAYCSKALEAGEKLKKSFSFFPTPKEAKPGEGSECLSEERKKLLLSKLGRAQKEISVLKQVLRSTDDEEKRLREAAKALDDGELKNMLSSEYMPLTKVFDEKRADELSADIKGDMELLSDSEAEISGGELAFLKNGLYGYMNASFGAKDEESEEEGAKEGKKAARELAAGMKELSETEQSQLWPFEAEAEKIKISELSRGKIKLGGGSDDRSFAERLKCNLFELEYLGGMFANAATKEEDENLTGKKYGQRAFVPCELEYIIFGRDRAADNVRAGADRIFLVRSLFNSLYLFSDAKRKNEALMLASAIAAGDAAKSKILQQFILLSWSAAESAVDLSSLYKGLSVPLYKNDSSFTLKLESIPEILKAGPEKYICRQIDDVFAQIGEKASLGIAAAADAATEYVRSSGEAASRGLVSVIMASVERRLGEIFQGSVVVSNVSEVAGELCKALDGIEAKSEGLLFVKESFLQSGIEETAKAAESVLSALSSPDKALAAAAEQRLNALLFSEREKLYLKTEEKIRGLEAKAEEKLRQLREENAELLKCKLVGITEAWAGELENFSGGTGGTSGTGGTGGFGGTGGTGVTGGTGGNGVIGGTGGNGGIGGTGVSSYCGLSLSYTEYLKGIAFMKMTTQRGRNNILGRALEIAEINCSAEGGEKDFSRCYTSAEIRTETKIRSHTIKSRRVFSYVGTSEDE